LPYLYRPHATSAEQWKSGSSTPTISSGSVGAAPASAQLGITQVARKAPVKTGVSGGAFGSLFSDPGKGLDRQGSRSQERGAPERLNADGMALIDTAVRTPASILERPVALLNRATGGAIAKGEDGGVLGAIGRFGIGPVTVGNGIGAINNALEFSGNLVPALANSTDAGLLAAFGERGDDFVIPGGIKQTGGGIFGIGAHDMTVGELKKNLRDRGFLEERQADGTVRELTWEELIAKIRNGGALGSAQFGDKAVSDNLIADTAYRILADPTNLLLGAGVLGKAGRIGKVAVDALGAAEKASNAGKFARWTLSPATKLVTGSGLRAVRGTGYLQDMVKLGLRSEKFAAPLATVQAIKEGRVAGATLKGLGLALKTPKAVFLPGTGSIAKRYARGAFRLQLGGLAVESGSGWVSDRLGEEANSGFFAGIHQASQEIMEDRPLSNSSAFVFASAFGMPLLHLAKEHLHAGNVALRDALGSPDLPIWSEWLGRDTSGLNVLKDPTGRLRGKAKQQALVDAFGGKEGFSKAIFHVDLKIAFDDLVKYKPVAEHFKSFDDALRSDRIGRIVAEHADEMRANGKITPRQRLSTFEDMARARYHTVVDREGNNLKDIREQRDFDLTPAQMIEQWVQYERVLDGIHSKFGPTAKGIIGRAKRLTKEDLGWLRSAVLAASKDGRNAVDPLRGMLTETAAMFNDPAVSANAERSAFWRGIMSMEGGNGQYSETPLAGLRKPRVRDVATQDLLDQIDVLDKEAPSAAELFGEAIAAEKAAPNDIPRAAGPMQGGRFRKIYSVDRLREMRVIRNRKLREAARAVEDAKKAYDQRWTSRGNLRVRRSRTIVGREVEPSGINEIRAEVQKLGLAPEESTAVEGLMLARAQAWSDATGRPTAEWLPTHIAEFRRGGNLEPGSLTQTAETPVVDQLRRALAETTDANGTILPDQVERAHAIQSRLERILAKEKGVDWQAAPLGAVPEQAVSEMHAAVQNEWGGATFDPRTGTFVDAIEGIDGPFASGVGITKTLTFDEAADPSLFAKALNDFVAENADELSQPDRAVGVFRDEDLHRVDIDVAQIDHTPESAMQTQIARGDQANGAYNFANKFYPEERNIFAPGREPGTMASEGGSTPIETVGSPGGRERGSLEPLLDKPAPKELVDAGMGDSSPLEWHKLENGEDYAIPGGLDGEFSLWDAWRLKAQQIDPNLIPEATRVRLYEKLFRSQQRSLSNPVDAWNRIAFAHLSPKGWLLKNETGAAALRVRSLDDIRKIAEAPTDELFQRVKAAGAASQTIGAQLRSLQVNARRFIENPEWFALRDGENLIDYSERIMSVLDGAGMKVGNFSAMVGDPLGHNRGTIDSHMMDVLRDAGYITPEFHDRLKGQAPSARMVPLLKLGKPNPDVPEHLRDLPWVRKDGKVLVFDGDYKIASDALDAYLHDLNPDFPFSSGGGQWYLWDLERRVVEPHTIIWPGATDLPTMEPGAIRAAEKVAQDAGYFRARGKQTPYDPAEAVFFQEGQAGVKGATRFQEDGRSVVQAFEQADISTAVHELGHVFRRDLTPDHLVTAEKHYGVQDGAWQPAHEEAFARDFERYLRDGKAPTKALVPIFQQLRDWMVRIYHTLKGSPLANRVSPEMRRVFDSLFKTDDMTMAQRSRLAVETGDLSLFGDGVPNVVERAVDTDSHATFVKRGANGEPVAVLDLELKNGRAAQDGVVERGSAQDVADLYREADAAGLQAEQAALVSSNLTPEMKANQKARWEEQRTAEQAAITASRERARAIRREIRDIDRQANRLRTVRIDDRFFDDEGNVKTDPKSLQNLREQQLYMLDQGYTRSYNLEPEPKLSYRFRPEDSHLAALLTERSMLGTMLVDYGPISKAVHAIDFLTRPVNSSKMAHDARQMLMNKMIALGAKPKEVNDFLSDLRTAAADFTVSKGEYAIFRGQSALPPNKINAIVRKHFGENKTFMAGIAKRGGIERAHTIVDEAYNSLVRRIDTKLLRGQEVGRLEKVFRSGYWAFQNVPGLRGVSDGTRMLSRTVYPMFRFIFDPRWILQNTVEADTIALFNDGLAGTRLSPRPEKVVRRMGQDVNISQNALAYHAAQSGLGKYLPSFVKEDVGTHPTLSPDLANEAGVTSINHHLYPVLRREFDLRRPEMIRKIIDELPENDPLIAHLIKKFGPDKGTWGEQLDEMLYSFDRRGVRKTIDEAVRRVSKYEKWSQAEFDQMQPLISKIVERNQQTFEDLIHMHIGNVDRSRIERVMNSFWLYWPLSYQIKAAKWMGHVLADRSFGGQTNLGGAWALDRLADQFRQRVENNPEFQQQLKDNEDLWFVGSMLLPIAPWDAGVSLNKLVRYAGGNVLDLWPEYAGLDNPGDYAVKMLEMGPLYTVKLAQRLWAQYGSEDKKEAA
jgi:hypothetical protein